MPRKVKPIFRFGFSNAVKTDRFPEKIYEVAEDDYLIHWNTTGTGILVDENEFSDAVMECYPGFLQISEFQNFRRLFREYSFEWEQIDTVFEFSHPSFIRGKPEIVCDVLTKRRSYHKTRTNTNSHPYQRPENIDDLFCENVSNESGRLTRRGFIPFREIQKEKTAEITKFDEKKAYKIHERPSLIKALGKENKLNNIGSFNLESIDNSQDEEEEDRLQNGGFEENKKAIENIINVFAINELSPEEFLEYLQRKRSKLISPEEDTPSSPMFHLRKKKENDANIPLPCDFQVNDFCFTQLRAVNDRLYSDEFLPQNWKNYHIMENISLNSETQQLEENAQKDELGKTCCKCACSCHLMTIQ